MNSILLQERPGVWDPQKTLKENAAALGTSEQNARHIAKTNNLEFKRLLFHGVKKRPIPIPRAQIPSPIKKEIYPSLRRYIDRETAISPIESSHGNPFKTDCSSDGFTWDEASVLI